MEKSQFETLKSSGGPFSLPPHRRSHLKSETFRTLVRILTHCYDDSQRSHASHIVQEKLTLDYGSNEFRQETTKEAHNELSIPDSSEPGNMSIQKDTVVDASAEESGNQGRSPSQVQMMIDELEHIMSTEGDEEPNQDNSVNLLTSLAGGNQTGSGAVASINNQEDYSDLQNFLMEESGDAEEVQVDSRHYNFEAPKALEPSLAKDIISKVPEPSEYNKDTSSSLKMNVLKEGEREMLQKETDLAKSVCTSSTMVVVDSEHYNFEAPKALEPSLTKDIISKVPESSENNEEKSSSLKMNVLEEGEHEMLQKETDLAKSVCTSSTMVLADSGHYNFEAPKALEPSLAKDIISKVPEPSENNEDKSSSLKMNVFMLQKETDLAKSDCTSSTMVYPPCMTAEEEIEEGEISDDSGVYKQSIDLFLEDAVALEEKKVDEEQIYEDVINKKVVNCKEQKGANEKSSSYIVDIVGNVDNGIEFHESNENVECKSKMLVYEKTLKDKNACGYNCMPEAGRKKNHDGGAKEGSKSPKTCPDDPMLHGKLLEENATNNQGITSTEKDAGTKKKRSRPSKEKKEKKKRKERLKRAEKNRQLGVKRLKLHPVLKPKTISYCKHYLKGRCQKGGECSFSHDAVPFTKSTPCSHFARNSCMKGDDCPFDHQLSKYPCNNYASKGFCSRGDNCLFSHKMPLNDGSPTASNVCKPELKSPSLPGNSNFKKQLNINFTSLQNVDTLSFAHKNTKQNIAETVLKPPAQAPKGISFLSFGKSPLDNSSMLKEAGPSPKGYNVEVGNQMNQSASDAVQILNETPKRSPPALAPEGIKLLSFGKAPVDYCQSKKQVTLALNRNNSPVDDSCKLKQACSSPKRDVEMAQGVLHTSHNVHEMPKRAPPVVAPPGINSLASGKVSLDDSSGEQQASSPFNRDNSIKRSIQERQSASDKLTNSCATPWKHPVSPFYSGQSSGQLSDGYKNKPTSAQKALLSTLAFAAKYESGMKMDRSIASPAVRAEVHKESSSSMNGSSQNNAMKAFDFIFGAGSKTKQ